jgi:hypothetical protein
LREEQIRELQRLEAENIERLRLEREMRERQEREREQLERERVERERMEQQRLERERQERESIEQQRLERERKERQERMEQQQRMERERKERERREDEVSDSSDNEESSGLNLVPHSQFVSELRQKLEERRKVIDQSLQNNENGKDSIEADIEMQDAQPSTSSKSKLLEDPRKTRPRGPGRPRTHQNTNSILNGIQLFVLLFF